MKKAFVAWSGGKDCMLALHRFQNSQSQVVSYLINMCNEDISLSCSHNISSELIKFQANSMNIPLLQIGTNRQTYREKFKKTIINLKFQGINTGVFGDIYLEPHRIWIEDLCEEVGIEAIFPLWGESSHSLLNDFIEEGFKSIIIAISNSKLDTSFLGRTINHSFLKDISKLEGIDVCAENGEYHSFVYDGPCFKNPINITAGNQYIDDKNSFIKLRYD